MQNFTTYVNQMDSQAIQTHICAASEHTCNEPSWNFYIDKEQNFSLEPIKNELTVLCQECSLSHTNNLIELVELYVSWTGWVVQQANEGKCSAQESFVIEKLIKWMNDEGYALLLRTIYCLQKNQQKQVCAFVDLCKLLFSSSSNDVDKVIDLLFTLPTQFYSLCQQEEDNI